MLFRSVLSAYFVASGKEVYNIFLSVLKNIVLIIPSMYFLAAMYGGNGIIWAFPLHDFIFLLLILGLIYKFVMTDLKQMQEKAAAAE